MRIHLIVNINWVVRYKEQVKRQKVEDEVKEWKIEKKRKIRGVVKYLV